MIFLSFSSVLELAYVSFVILRDKGWICVSLILSFSRRSSWFEILDDISVIVFSILVCLVTSVCNFLEYSSDAVSQTVIHCFHLRVNVVICGYHFILKMVKFMFGRYGEVGEVEGTIASDSLYVMDLYRVFMEVVIMRNIYRLGFFGLIYI